jgi:hypothetical protein
MRNVLMRLWNYETGSLWIWISLCIFAILLLNDLFS